MVAYWLKAQRGLAQPSELEAKCWDLSDAYKQIPLSDSAFEREAYLAVSDPEEQRAVVYQQKVLPFGPIASVTAFLRVSLALWALGNHLLHLTWSAYFDDFLSLSDKSTAKHTELCITALFSFLGWKLSADKLVPFDSCCKVLGVQLDLSETSLGRAAISNTQERVEELTSDISATLQSGLLNKKLCSS